MIGRRIVVLGVGNLIMGDEGLGVRCIERLEAAGSLPADVTIVDGGTSTNELLGDLENLDLLVIVDAVVTSTVHSSSLPSENGRQSYAVVVGAEPTRT